MQLFFLKTKRPKYKVMTDMSSLINHPHKAKTHVLNIKILIQLVECHLNLPC